MIELASDISVSSEQAVDLLSQEYFFLQDTVENFNAQVIDFKAWSASVGIAALLAAYTKPIAAAGRIGVAVAGLAALPFWLTETFWKLFQEAYEARLTKIESCFRGAGECESLFPLQTWTAWDASFREAPFLSWLSVAFDFHVILPHLFLLALGLVLAWRWPPRPDRT